MSPLKSAVMRQCWIALSVLLNVVSVGFAFGFPSVLSSGLAADGQPLTEEQGSWIAAMVGISSVPGFVLFALVMAHWGRRVAHILVAVPMSANWLLFYISKDFSSFVIARLLCGLTLGGFVTLGAIIIGEYSSPTIRPVFLNLKTTATILGVIIVHFLGQYFHWRQVALIALIPSTIACLMTFMWPESPSWLASIGEFEKSEAAFYWIRGESDVSQDELYQMLKVQKKRIELIAYEKSSIGRLVVPFLKKFTRKDFIKPVVIVGFAFILLEACGRHVFPAFAKDIVGGMCGSTDKTVVDNYILGIDATTLVTVLASCALVRIFRRRVLLFWSGACSLVLLVSMSIYLELVSRGILQGEGQVAVTLLFLYYVAVNIGATPIPLALLGEVFPLEHRAAGSVAAGVLMSVSLTVTLKVTPILLRVTQLQGTFLVFGAAMACALLYLYFFLPETKDKTLQEIEYFLNHGHFPDKNNDVQLKDERVGMLNKPLNNKTIQSPHLDTH